MPAPAGMRGVDGHNPAPRRRHICTGIATTRCADGGSPSPRDWDDGRFVVAAGLAARENVRRQ